MCLPKVQCNAQRVNAIDRIALTNAHISAVQLYVSIYICPVLSESETRRLELTKARAEKQSTATPDALLDGSAS